MTTATPAAAPDRMTRRPSTRIPGLTKLNYWLDLAIVAAFALDYSFRFTGLTIHEWIGLGFGLALMVHLTLHWDWVVKTTRRLVGRAAGRERLRWLVDLGLVTVMTLCVASGVLISRSALPAIGLHPVGGPFWHELHTTMADITIVLVGIHIALSWRWILSVSRRLIGRPKQQVAT